MFSKSLVCKDCANPDFHKLRRLEKFGFKKSSKGDILGDKISVMRLIFSNAGMKESCWDSLRKKMLKYIPMNALLNTPLDDDIEELETTKNTDSNLPKVIQLSKSLDKYLHHYQPYNSKETTSSYILTRLSKKLKAINTAANIFVSIVQSSKRYPSILPAEICSSLPDAKYISLMYLIVIKSKHPFRMKDTYGLRKFFIRIVFLSEFLSFSISQKDSDLIKFLSYQMISAGMSKNNLDLLGHIGIAINHKSLNNFLLEITQSDEFYEFIGTEIGRFMQNIDQDHDLSIGIMTDNFNTIQHRRVFGHRGVKSDVNSGQVAGVTFSTVPVPRNLSNDHSRTKISHSTFKPTIVEATLQRHFYRQFISPIVLIVQQYESIDEFIGRNIKDVVAASCLSDANSAIDPTFSKFIPSAIGLFMGVDIDEKFSANTYQLICKSIKRVLSGTKSISRVLHAPTDLNSVPQYVPLTHNQSLDSKNSIEVSPKSPPRKNRSSPISNSLTNLSAAFSLSPPKVNLNQSSSRQKREREDDSSDSKIFLTVGGDQSTMASLAKGIHLGKLEPSSFFQGLWHLSLNAQKMVLTSFGKYINFSEWTSLIDVPIFSPKYFKRTHNSLLQMAVTFIFVYLFENKGYQMLDSHEALEPKIKKSINSSLTSEVWWKFTYSVFTIHLLLLSKVYHNMDLVSALLKELNAMFHAWSRKKLYQILCSRQIAHLELLSPKERFCLSSCSLSIHSLSNLFIEDGQLYSSSKPFSMDEFNEHLVKNAKQFSRHSTSIDTKRVNSLLGLSFLNSSFTDLMDRVHHKDQKFGFNVLNALNTAKKIISLPSTYSWRKSISSAKPSKDVVHIFGERTKVKLKTVRSEYHIGIFCSLSNATGRSLNTMRTYLGVEEPTSSTLITSLENSTSNPNSD